MYGIVLEGGGARGAYQIGFWQAFRELGLEYLGVAGTSIGALNAALLAQGDLERAVGLWTSITPTKVFDVDPDLYERVRNLDITTNNISGLFQFFKTTLRSKGLDTTPLRRLLSEYVDEKRVRAAGLEFGMVTVGLPDLRPLKVYLEDIPAGKLIDYILASARLPIFRPEAINGKRYLDGGFYDNLPIDLLTARGLKEIVAVRLKSIGVRRRPKGEIERITTIEPSGYLGPVLDVSRERSKTNLLMGYYDTLRVFRGLPGRQYYLESLPADDYFFSRLSQTDAANIGHLKESLRGYEQTPDRRFVFEVLVPLLAQLLALDERATYGEIVLALLERAAAIAGMERLRIYAYPEFLAAVRQKYASPEGEGLVLLPGIRQAFDSMLWPHREQVLDAVTRLILPELSDDD